jgi:hypothetical protein
VSRIHGGALVGTAGMSSEVASRIFRALDLERSGVDLDSTHPAAAVLGRLAELLPDFYHLTVLGEVSAEEFAALALDLEHAARLCRAHAGQHP